MITINAQIKCVERELRFRAKVYVRLVEQGQLTQQKSDYEMAAMAAVLDTLKRMQKGEMLL